jgi:iron(III) transport system substrate-binding protein
MLKKPVAILAAVLLMSFAAACGDDKPRSELKGSWEGIVAAANDEGTVTFYSPLAQPVIDELEKAFEKKYPRIDANMVRLNGSEIVPRVDGERQANKGGADVITTTMPPFLDAILKDKQLAEIVAPSFAAAKKTFGSGSDLVKDNYYAPHYAEPYWIVWNTKRVTKPITGYQDLIERSDEFRNEIGAPDLYGDIAIDYYLRIMKGADGPSVTKPSDSEFLNDFAALHPRFYESGVPATNAVGAGELKASIYSIGAVWRGLKAQGSPIDGVLDPNAPTSSNAYVAVTKWGKNPNAAQVFADFLFSKEGQEAAAKGGGVTVLPNMDGSSGDASSMRAFQHEVTDHTYAADFQSSWKKLFR